MDVIFDWNLGNMIYNGPITLRLYGFPFAEIGLFHLFGISAQNSDRMFFILKCILNVKCISWNYFIGYSQTLA